MKKYSVIQIDKGETDKYSRLDTDILDEAKFKMYLLAVGVIGELGSRLFIQDNETGREVLWEV